MKIITLGTKVRDTVTGFEGTATARCEYLNGCVQYEVTPSELKDGCPQKEYWLDEQRVEEIKPKKRKKKAVKRNDPFLIRRPRGGPQNHPVAKNPSSLAGYE